jgi:hypothetical protein
MSMKIHTAGAALSGALALAACFPLGDSKPAQPPADTTIAGSSQGQATRTPQPEAIPAAPEPAATLPPVATSAAQRAAEPAPLPKIPAGTELHVVLEHTVSSDESTAGDVVTATLRRPVEVQGVVVLAKGTLLRGHVTEAARAGRIKGKARLGFVFDRIVLASGAEKRIVTEPFFFEARGTGKRDAATVAGGAGLGGVIGGIVGGKKGAAIGVAVGAGAGGGTVLATKGKELLVSKGQDLSVRLDEALKPS